MRSRCVNETTNLFWSVIVVLSLKQPIRLFFFYYYFFWQTKTKHINDRPTTTMTRSRWRRWVSKGKSTKDAAEEGRVGDNDIKVRRGRYDRTRCQPLLTTMHRNMSQQELARASTEELRWRVMLDVCLCEVSRIEAMEGVCGCESQTRTRSITPCLTLWRAIAHKYTAKDKRGGRNRAKEGVILDIVARGVYWSGGTEKGHGIVEDVPAMEGKTNKHATGVR